MKIIKTYNEIFENEIPNTTLNLKMVENLVSKNGINYLYRYDTGIEKVTLLMYLIYKRIQGTIWIYTEQIKWLLENGAIINNNGVSELGTYLPIEAACFHNDEELFNILIEYNPDLTLPGLNNEIPLESATSSRIERPSNLEEVKLNMNIIKKLVNKNSPLFFTNPPSKTWNLFNFLSKEQEKDIYDNCSSKNLTDFPMIISMIDFNI